MVVEEAMAEEETLYSCTPTQVLHEFVVDLGSKILDRKEPNFSLACYLFYFGR